MYTMMISKSSPELHGYFFALQGKRQQIIQEDSHRLKKSPAIAQAVVKGKSTHDNHNEFHISMDIWMNI